MPAKKKPTKRKASAKETAEGDRRPASCSRFWVIDLESPGISQGEHGARGPFHSRKAAEDWIKEDTKHVWLNSCTCLKNVERWNDPLIIVEEVATVRPKVESWCRVSLEVDAANDPTHARPKP